MEWGFIGPGRMLCQPFSRRAALWHTVVGGGQRGCQSCSGPLSNTLLMFEVTDFLRAA